VRERDNLALPPIPDKNHHWRTLFFDDVPDRLANSLIIPQPSRASMPCPALPVGAAVFYGIQTPAGVRLEAIHDPLRPILRLDYNVHVVSANVCGDKIPAPVRANLMESVEHGRPPNFVHHVWFLVHRAVLD
jgi:hypothetical protein